MLTHTPDRSSQLLSHIHADQLERWRRGEIVRVEHYLALYPDLAGETEALLDLIDFELRHRRKNGEHPPLDEYLSRFPQLGDAVRRLWASPRRDETPGRSASDILATTAAGLTEEFRFSRRSASAPTLPGFEMHEKLGESGMGVVYKARDLRLNQFRAIKFIRAGIADEAAQERFGREAKAAARLDHPGVVRIHAMGEHEGELFICMEYLEGGNLHARLRRGPLDFRVAAELVRQLALAVQHAHDNKVLHRDLKPANVLLTVAGAPKVADFGLAKLLDEDNGLTRIGDVMGTPSYMAPEQAEGRVRDVGERADVWALGAILYECLTGRPPFKGEGRSETMELVKKQPPTPLRRLRAETPAELESICLKCLEKRQEDRYAAAAELADELQDWLDGKPVCQRPGQRRSRLRLLAVLALVLLVGSVAALLFYPGHRSPNDPVVPSTAELRPEPGVWTPLLAQEPETLVWPRPGKFSRKSYKPDERELLVSCEELGLLALGQTTAPRYRLILTMQQSPWVGDIGVFFGYRENADSERPERHYQILALNLALAEKHRQLLRLGWKTVTEKDGRESRGTKAVSAFFPLSPREHRLGITIGPDGLEEVILDDTVLPALRSSVATNPPRPSDFRGAFGVYVSTASGVFRDGHYFSPKEH